MWNFTSKIFFLNQLRLEKDLIYDIMHLMNQLLLNQVKKAIRDYKMIDKNDLVGVGLSGGKDSLALLYALCEINSHLKDPFNLIAITIKLSKDNPDTSYLQKVCDKLGVTFHIVDTDIEEVVFDVREEKSPCSLCANLRRGILNDTAKSLGCTKVALGHNRDDAVETFLMSLFYEGRIHNFSPLTYLSRKDITIIRPLIYSWEKDIINFNDLLKIKPVKNPCKVAGKTTRQSIKEFIKEEEKTNEDFKYNLFKAFTKGQVSGWKEVIK